MGLRIEFAVREGDRDKRHSLAFAQGRVIVGRGRGTDVQLPDTSVSLQHLALEHVGGHWTATDLDSTNGTWFSGSRLIPGRPMRIDEAGPLQVGTRVLTLTLEPVAQGASDAQTQSLAKALLRAELCADGAPVEAPSLLVLSELAKGERRTLSVGQDLMVGRGENCGLSIPDAELSREHLLVRFDGHTIELIDQGTKNGSRLGGRVFDRTLVASGEHIHLGATTLLVEDPIDDLLAERIELPDDRVPLARASRVPPPTAAEDALKAESPDEKTTSRSKENRRIIAGDKASAAALGGGERLLFGFALLLLIASIGGLWILFR